MKLRTVEPKWIEASEAAMIVNPNWKEKQLLDFIKEKGLVPPNFEFYKEYGYKNIYRRLMNRREKDFDYTVPEVSDQCMVLLQNIFNKEADEFYKEQEDYYRSIGELP